MPSLSVLFSDAVALHHCLKKCVTAHQNHTEFLSVSSIPAPAPVVEYFAPAPSVVLAPTPVVESFSPAPAVSRSQTPVVKSLAPAPVLSEAPAPGGFLSHAPAVFRVGSLQGSVPGPSSTSRRRHDLPLPSGWRRADDASGRVYCWHVHTRQTPPVSDDEDEDVEDEEDEEEDEDEDEDEEDEDMDETYVTESRFPAGFRPMRMCRWPPGTSGRDGGVCLLTR